MTYCYYHLMIISLSLLFAYVISNAITLNERFFRSIYKTGFISFSSCYKECVRDRKKEGKGREGREACLFLPSSSAKEITHVQHDDYKQHFVLPCRTVMNYQARLSFIHSFIHSFECIQRIDTISLWRVQQEEKA